MGFKRFSAHVKKRKKCFRDIKLHSLTLVIDGNNIASILYRQALKTDYVFNGDYDVFAESVRNFFTELLYFKIDPLVILDGGYELRKLNAIQARLLYSTRDIRRLRKEKNSDPFLPLLIIEVFKEVLQDMKIKFAQSRYEADVDIIELAKFFNCPILSSDSDYYFSDTEFIPFFSVKFPTIKKDTKKDEYISGKVFSIDSFLTDFGGLPDKSYLSLLALLLGDYMEIKHFKKLYLSLLEDEEERKKFRLTDYDRNLKILCTWFWQLHSYDAVISKIEASVPLQFKRFVRKQLKLLTEKQKNPEKSLLLDFFRDWEDHHQKNVYSQLDSLCLTDDLPASMSGSETPKLINCLSPSGKTMEVPEWFLESEKKGTFSRHVSNILNLRTVLLWTQLESFDLPSIHTIIFPILRVIAGILLSTSKRKRSAPLACYVRNKTGFDISKELLMPDYPSDPVSFNSLIFLPVSAHEKILLDALSIDSFSSGNIPVEWSLLFLTLIFFLKNSQLSENQKPIFVSAFLLSFLLVNLADEHQIPPSQYHFKIKGKNNPVTHEGQAILNDDSHQIEKNTESLRHLREVAKNSHDLRCNLVEVFHRIDRCEVPSKVIDRLTTHYYAELQAVFQFISILNSILNFPFPQLSVAKSLSGSIVYKLVFGIRRSPSLFGFINSLSVDPIVRDLFFVSLKFIEGSSLCNLTNINVDNSDKLIT